MEVKFFKQNQINKNHKRSLIKAIDNLIDGTSPLVNGTFSKRFEVNFAKYIGCKYCAFLSNGLDALFIALKIIGVTKYDEVIVPNHTYIATWIAALNLECTLVPVPVKEETLLIDEDKIQQYISPKTKAIVPVHLYGNSTNINKIKSIAKKGGIYVIDDAAQAHGCKKDSQRIGSFFDMSCFSFYPTKNLGALGEAGCITTNNIEFYEKIKSIRNYGKSPNNPFLNLYQGGNFRGDEIQAAFLISKLSQIEKIIQKRNENLQIYKKLLSNNCNRYLNLLNYTNESSPHLLIIRLNNFEKRDKLIEFLKSRKIESLVHYKIPCHQQFFIKKDQVKIDKFVGEQATRISKSIVSLPFSEVHTKEEITFVVNSIQEFFKMENIN